MLASPAPVPPHLRGSTDGSLRGTATDPLAAHHACATGTMHVLMASREARVRRVVYASNSAVYGNGGEILKREKGQMNPLTPYAAAKLAGEKYCAAFTQCYGLETVRLRYFNVFGPRQLASHPDAGVVPLFFEAMLNGR